MVDRRHTTPTMDRHGTPVDERYHDENSKKPWILGLIAAAVAAVVLFFALGGDADVDVEGGDVDLPAVDADVDAPDVDVNAPDVDVEGGSVDVDDADAEADADG